VVKNRGVPDLLTVPCLTVRATTSWSVSTGAREYDLVDADGHRIGGVTPEVTSVTHIASRVLADRAGSKRGAFEVREESGALVCRVTQQPSGLLRMRLRGEVALADGRLVAVVTGAGSAFELADAGGARSATVARAGRTWLRATGPGGTYAEVDREANTLSARRAGTAHPRSLVVRFDDAVPLALRLGILAVVVMSENRLRG
jgi:hypothetical protein